MYILVTIACGRVAPRPPPAHIRVRLQGSGRSGDKSREINPRVHGYKDSDSLRRSRRTHPLSQSAARPSRHHVCVQLQGSDWSGEKTAHGLQRFGCARMCCLPRPVRKTPSTLWRIMHQRMCACAGGCARARARAPARGGVRGRPGRAQARSIGQRTGLAQSRRCPELAGACASLRMLKDAGGGKANLAPTRQG